MHIQDFHCVEVIVRYGLGGSRESSIAILEGYGAWKIHSISNISEVLDLKISLTLCNIQ